MATAEWPMCAARACGSRHAANVARQLIPIHRDAYLCAIGPDLRDWNVVAITLPAPAFECPASWDCAFSVWRVFDDSIWYYRLLLHSHKRQPVAYRVPEELLSASRKQPLPASSSFSSSVTRSGCNSYPVTLSVHGWSGPAAPLRRLRSTCHSVTLSRRLDSCPLSPRKALSAAGCVVLAFRNTCDWASKGEVATAWHTH